MCGMSLKLLTVLISIDFPQFFVGNQLPDVAILPLYKAHLGLRYVQKGFLLSLAGLVLALLSHFRGVSYLLMQDPIRPLVAIQSSSMSEQSQHTD